jgi:predicted aspartyl protease
MMDLMGLFRVQIAVAPMEGDVSVSIPDALVDTGSEYTWVPRAALTAAGILPRRTQSVIVADGRQLEREIGYALVRAAGAEAPDLVVFAEPGDLVLLGVHSLEGLNLRVDPVRKELIPAGPVITGCAA